MINECSLGSCGRTEDILNDREDSNRGLLKIELKRACSRRNSEFGAQWKRLAAAPVANNTPWATPPPLPCAAPGRPLHGNRRREKEASSRLGWVPPVLGVTLGFEYLHRTLMTTWHGWCFDPIFRDDDRVKKTQNWDSSPETLVSEVHTLSHLSHRLLWDPVGP